MVPKESKERQALQVHQEYQGFQDHQDKLVLQARWESNETVTLNITCIFNHFQAFWQPNTHSDLKTYLPSLLMSY